MGYCCDTELVVELASQDAQLIFPPSTDPMAPPPIFGTVGYVRLYMYPEGTIQNCNFPPPNFYVDNNVPAFFPSCGITLTGNPSPPFTAEYPNSLIGHAYSEITLNNPDFQSFFNASLAYQASFASLGPFDPATQAAADNVISSISSPPLVGKLQSESVVTLLFDDDASNKDPNELLKDPSLDTIRFRFQVVTGQGVEEEGIVLGGTGKYRKVKGTVKLERLMQPNIAGLSSLRAIFKLKGISS